jgi:putative intracellular protease/amidase
MAKKVAVLVVNPVNGAGLFQYLETFFENGIPYKTFAIAETTGVKTNSGVSLQTDDKIANLKGREDEYDALVLACGDGMPKFNENVEKSHNQDLLTVIKNFSDKGKILAGHCAAGLIFDNFDAAKGKRVALHPYVKALVKNSIGTDEKFVVDGNIYTAQTEHSVSHLLPYLLKALSEIMYF